MQSSGGTLPITITGTGFVAQSTVRLGSSYVFPTSVAPTQIVANVPLITLGVPGTIQLTVFNPAPGGGPSNDVDFSVLYPVPTITVLSPDSNVTGAGFTLTVSGTGFATGIGTSSVVRWNGEDRPTTS
jgi:hypothetical protein